MMAVTLPTLSNQFPNVIIRTAHHLTAFIDTVPVEPYSWAYVKDGEWVELDSTTGKYKVPGAGAVPAALALNTKTLYIVTGKTTEPPRQAMTRDVEDSYNNQDAEEGYLPIYKGHEPVEIDTKVIDSAPGAAWTVGGSVYVISELDGDGNARTFLSPESTVGGNAGLLVGTLVQAPSANALSMARFRLTV